MRFLLFSFLFLIALLGSASAADNPFLKADIQGTIQVEPNVAKPLRLPTQMRFQLHYRSRQAEEPQDVVRMIDSELALVLMAVDSNDVYLDSKHTLRSQVFDSQAAATQRVESILYHTLMGLLPRPTTVKLSIDSMEIKQATSDAITMHPTRPMQVTITLRKPDIESK